jgi:hypothetical protein
MTIKFSVLGNQDDPHANPIPKIKKTFRQRWTPEAQRYARWKEYVQAAAQPALIAALHDLKPDQKAPDHQRLKAVPKARMDIKIYWANERHADPESVFGSIADAIFSDDKHLAGKITFIHAPDKRGKVDVTIQI